MGALSRPNIAKALFLLTTNKEVWVTPDNFGVLSSADKALLSTYLARFFKDYGSPTKPYRLEVENTTHLFVVHRRPHVTSKMYKFEYQVGNITTEAQPSLVTLKTETPQLVEQPQLDSPLPSSHESSLSRNLISLTTAVDSFVLAIRSLVQDIVEEEIAKALQVNTQAILQKTKQVTKFPDIEKPRIAVIGLKESHQSIFAAEYKSVIDLTFIPADSPTSISNQIPQKDFVVVLTDHVSHVVFDVVKNHKGYTPMTGSASSLRKTLEQLWEKFYSK